METFTLLLLLGGMLIGAGVVLLLAALAICLTLCYAKN